MNDHKDAVRISKQPEGTYDHRAVLNLKARYLEVVAQLEAERKLNNDLALGNLKAQHAGSLLIRDLREQLEVLQRARITNVSDVMRENEALRKDAEIAALRKDYNELIMALAAAPDTPTPRTEDDEPCYYCHHKQHEGSPLCPGIEIDRQAHKIGQLERELASTTYAAQTLAESLKTTQLQVQELGGQLAAAQEELKQMRILAANPHSIQSVKDHLGPLSMWSQSGLEEHDRQILQAANAEIEALRNDAERFQWIDANCREGEGTDAWPFCVRFVTPSRFGVNMRAAIDAAMKERK
jgi:hypothetical protein